LTDDEIVLLTGRRASCIPDTIDWLRVWAPCLAGCHILSRRDSDCRNDIETKPEQLKMFMNDYGIEHSEIAFILEDRSSMVKKWRELGYTCLQVADGDF